jgi:hypothetical protein
VGWNQLAQDRDISEYGDEAWVPYIAGNLLSR